MTTHHFWQIIEAAREEGGHRLALVKASSQRTLSSLPAADILSFAEILSHYLGKANRYDLWAAAYILAGYCGDDSFLDFRKWLVSMGQLVYEAALKDPESLALVELGEDGIFFEDFTSAAPDAYSAVTGLDWHNDPSTADQLRSPLANIRGVKWTSDAELAASFPRLFERFGKAG